MMTNAMEPAINKYEGRMRNNTLPFLSNLLYTHTQFEFLAFIQCILSCVNMKACSSAIPTRVT